jgi:hypothetical protein
VFPLSKISNFPFEGVGQIVFKRKHFIERNVKMVLEDKELSKHYWRAPRGSGKTVFLSLMGEALQQKGCKVYYIRSSTLLDTLSTDSLLQNAAKATAEGKRMVIMIDEAHMNTKSDLWWYLFKHDLLVPHIVLGVGVPKVGEISVDFFRKHPPSNFFPSCEEEDFDELVQIWRNQAGSKNVPKDLVAEICMWVCKFTGGQMYPMMMFLEHILMENVDQATNYQTYFRSQEFMGSDPAKKASSRCGFDGNEYNLGRFQQVVMSTSSTSSVLQDMERIGVWNPERRWFFSDFLVNFMLNNNIPEPSKDSKNPLSRIPNINEKIEEIIITGLKGMSYMDFKETYDDYTNLSKCEDAIGFCWAYQLKDADRSLFIASQTKGDRVHAGKKFPSVDFVVNGSLDVAIELSKNSYDLKNKISKFSEERGVYRRWFDRFAILNFQLEERPVKNLFNDPRVYHFVKSENALYKGKNLVRQGVSPSLPTPPLFAS